MFFAEKKPDEKPAEVAAAPEIAIGCTCDVERPCAWCSLSDAEREKRRNGNK